MLVTVSTSPVEYEAYLTVDASAWSTGRNLIGETFQVIAYRTFSDARKILLTNPIYRFSRARFLVSRYNLQGGE